MWITGLLLVMIGFGTGALAVLRPSVVNEAQRRYGISRSSVVVILGLVLMFVGTRPVENGMAQINLGVYVIVAILLSALLVAHFSRDAGAGSLAVTRDGG